MGIFNSNSLRVISGADGLEFVIIEYQGKPYRISAADFITALGLSSGGGGVDEAALRASLGTLTGATDLGSFLGTTISNSATVKTALQQLETALEAMTADISGQFLGSAATFVALPTPAEASNGDWAVLTSDDGGNTSGIYVYDGTNYSFVMEIADSFTAAANAISPAADDATGAIGATTEYAREDHKHPAQGVSTDVNNILVVGSDGLHLLALDATGFAGNLDTDDDTLQEVAQKFDDYIPGKDRVFAPSTDVVVVTVGKPTAAELKVWNDGLVSPNTDTIIFYTGTITSTDAITYVYHIDKSGIVTLVQAPSTGGGIAEWDASTAYDAGEMVITPSKALVKRTAAGTSTATFDATEAGDWTYIADTANYKDWAANTYYYSGQGVKAPLGRYLERDVAGYTPATFDDVAEVNQWILISQSTISAWAPNTNIVEYQKVQLDDGVFRTTNPSALSSATFDEDIEDYVPVVEDTSYKSLFWSEAFEPSISGQLGYGTVVKDQTSGGYGLKYYDNDDTGAGIVVFSKSLTEEFVLGDSYQIRAIVGKKAVAQSSILRYTDASGNTAEIKIRLNTGVIIANTVVGNVNLTATSQELTRGADGAYQIDMIMSMTGAVGGGFGRIDFAPVLNNDGSSVADATATGGAELIDIQVGAASEFVDEGIETIRVDASASAIALTLGAASGTGNTFLYSLVDKTNEATVAVQVGEDLNSVTDGLFYLSNFDVGTTFMVTDRAVGKWDIAVVGASASDNLARYAIRRVYNTSSPQAPTNITTIDMDFSKGVVGFDTGNFTLDGATSTQVTCNKDGDYVINLQIVGEDAGGSASRLIVELFVDGILIQRSHNTNDNGGLDCTIIAPISLTSGQVIDVELSTSDAETCYVHGFDLFIEELPSQQVALAGMTPVEKLTYAYAGVDVGGYVVPTVVTSGIAKFDLSDAQILVYDPNAMIDYVDNKFTISNSGLYELTSSGYNTVANSRQCSIFVDGTKVAGGSPSTGNSDQTVNWIGTLSAGQEVAFGSNVTSAEDWQGVSMGIKQLPTSTIVPITLATKASASGSVRNIIPGLPAGPFTEGDVVSVVVTEPTANTSLIAVTMTETFSSDYELLVTLLMDATIGLDYDYCVEKTGLNSFEILVRDTLSAGDGVEFSFLAISR